MAVIERDIEALVRHLRRPAEHRKRIRSSNLLERSFVEVRPRTKVIGRFPGENLGAVARLGGTRALKPRLARRRHDTEIVAEIERLRRQQVGVRGDEAPDGKEVAAA